MSLSTATTPALQVLGVRHHGPGSARAVRAALAEISPDCVLVEGPPDADDLIPWLAHPAMVMPTALLVYRPDSPRRGTFYPYAVFSPEYQALRYALANDIAAGFMDLPQCHLLAGEHRAAMPEEVAFMTIARATGYPSYEKWWDDTIEHRQDHRELFAAVLELMKTMRSTAGEASPAGEQEAGRRLADQREAAMRQRIRRAAGDGHRNIVAVCGAWHAPALTQALTDAPGPDVVLLDGLPTVEIAAGWIPWTYGRLAQSSGYGAGITSPGWYDHLWTANELAQSSAERSAHWLGKVAALLRGEGLDISPAHVIDTIRLAESLAAMRGRPLPGLAELNEAILSVMCGGEQEPMQLIARRLIIGERMGTVPPDGPAVPLQRDLQEQQRRLDLRPDPEPAGLMLDLRRDRDLDRSRLFHRLALLEIPWGKPLKAATGANAPLGTFNEHWQLQWLPELSLRVVEASMWGNTVRDASAAFTESVVARITELPELTQFIDRVLRADLPEVLPPVLSRIEELAAASRDVGYMLAALPPLANILRYGGLRPTADHIPQLRRVFEHLLTRACLGLPVACRALDEAAANEMIEHLSAAHSAIRLDQDRDNLARWYGTLMQLLDRPGIVPLVAGRAARLLHEANMLQAPELTVRFERALNIGSGGQAEVRYAAGWLDGFFRDSGLLLVHDERLWHGVDGWLGRLGRREFHAVLPLLRRTFSTFPEAVRRQLQDRARRLDAPGMMVTGTAVSFDPQRAAAIWPVVEHILGISLAGSPTGAGDPD